MLPSPRRLARAVLALAPLAPLAPLALLATTGTATGCVADATSDAAESDFTSSVSTLLDFDFDGEVVATTGTAVRSAARAQLLFMVGHLNGEGGAPRLGKLTLTNVTSSALVGGLTRFRFHAKLPVAWPSKATLPTTYALSVPRRADPQGQADFLARYGATCTEEAGANVSNYWYHYRPRAGGCALAAADVSSANATVTRSPLNATAKYPEYHRVWDDGSFDVVAVFGKYEEGATSPSDAGIEAYDRFVGALRGAFPSATVVPAGLPAAPGAANPDVSLEVAFPNGRTLHVNALLVDKVATAPASFDARFAELTPGADLLIYDGHAGLGVNLRALTAKARFFPGKYQLLFLNGCDSFAYEDDSLATARALLNADDRPGTKYLDVMLNAMPAYFSSMPGASMALIQALLHDEAPKTYEAIFKGIDTAQNVVVVGEEDNAYVPTWSSVGRWKGQSLAGSVTYKQQTPFVSELLPAGRYVFSLTPSPSAPGGDADLYLKVGAAPPIDATAKCPSYKANSNERCFVTLSAPSKVYGAIVGDKQTSSQWLLRAFQKID
jgi:hypothetical protein